MATNKYKIKEVKHLKKFQLEITFNDGFVRQIDFKPFLAEYKDHPMIKPYANIKAFKNFKNQQHYISWNEEMDFSAESLYQSDWSATQIKQNREKIMKYARDNGLI